MFEQLIAEVIRAGEAAGRAHLVARGHPDRLLTAAVRAGALRRARRGWYTVWPADDPRFRALRLGGRLTGLTAIIALGGWVLHRPKRMHVAVPVNASRLRCPRRRRVAFSRSSERPRVTLHWTRERHDRDTCTGIVPLLEALEVVCRMEPVEDAIAAIDWARRAGRADALDLAALASRLPADRRHLVAASSGSCHSLPESLARTRLRALGLRVREQVMLPESPSPLDLLVEESVAVEVDGEQFHRERFEVDRAKDLAATRCGFHALRPAARHVFEEWPAVLEAIRVALSARGVRLPVAASDPRRASADNSGPTKRCRRRSRAVPRSSSPRPRRPPPMVLNC
ncbi:endonuclease domain-containing protein [Microcella alkalica]|uniref:endonuclease domain-containing protein n=1 Tax=Microcella alkalica TaxID=355930 RepID=UPI00145E703A|nr:glycyl-tRNA synthetase [Microcella alkalica]